MMSERKSSYQQVPGQMKFGDTEAIVSKDTEAEHADREKEVLQKLEQIVFHTTHPDQEKERMNLEDYYLFTADRSFRNPEKYLSVYEPLIAEKLKQFLENSEIEIVANTIKRKAVSANRELGLLKNRLEKAESSLELDSQPYYGENIWELKKEITSQLEKTEKLNALADFLTSIIEAT